MQVPLWMLFGSISQIMSRFNFEEVCFLDNLVLRLATKYPSIVIYPFRMSHECFNELHPKAANPRPLIQQILNSIDNRFLQKFVDSLKVLNSPERVLHHHFKIFQHNATSKLEQRRLRVACESVFNSPFRGELSARVKSYQADFDELIGMFGMFTSVIEFSESNAFFPAFG